MIPKNLRQTQLLHPTSSNNKASPISQEMSNTPAHTILIHPVHIWLWSLAAANVNKSRSIPSKQRGMFIEHVVSVGVPQNPLMNLFVPYTVKLPSCSNAPNVFGSSNMGPFAPRQRLAIASKTRVRLLKSPNKMVGESEFDRSKSYSNP